MWLQHFFNLILVLIFNNLYHRVLIIFVFVLCTASSLLQLLQSDLKLALWFDKVSFVIFLLVFQKLAFTFPESFIFVIAWLKVWELALQLSHCRLQLHNWFCLSVAIIKGLTCAWIEVLDLSFILLDLLLILCFRLPPALFDTSIILLQ